MDSIAQIRQMMAEQKFFEAQKLIEVQLTLNLEARHELLLLYFESLENQHKVLPQDFAVELAEYETSSKKFESALQLITHVSSEKFFIRLLKIKVTVSEEKGRMQELYNLLSEFLLRQFEKQVPSIPEWITVLIDKYFRDDFTIKLKRLALALVLNDLSLSEALAKELIVSSFEHSSPKGISAKLSSIGEVLRSGHQKAHLEIYQNFCSIYAEGIQDRADYKRLVEMTIYFDDFRFQVILMNLFFNLGLHDELELYSSAVKENKEYSYVYLDKYFSHLKKFFFQKTKAKVAEEIIETPDLKLTDKYRSELMTPAEDIEINEDEQQYLHLLKYQSFSTDQLCDLAVSFLQSEMPGVAFKASQMAVEASADDKDFMKASYLKLTSQLKLRDFRAAIDTCFIALNKAVSKDDILSFMYGQAEAYIRLNQKKQAKTVLSKILSIDAKYRLAKERLDKLNEI